MTQSATGRLRSVEGERFDVIVVGGGIVGAGVARDAALRGLRVALFEKGDFGGGTTAASTRIVHGGLRYLEMYDFRLVRLDLRERDTLLRIAPHLVQPLEFLIPYYERSRWYRLRLRAGLTLYDALAFDGSLPGHRALSRQAVLDAEPALRPEGLQGGASYYDARVDSPERLCLENVIDAREHGARTFNYVEVTGAIRRGERVEGVRVRDALDGREADVRGRVLVNASGPWFDEVAARLAPHAPRRLVLTKGIHLLCPPLTRRAVVLFSRLDGRIIFVIPRAGLTWIGTTDTPFAGDPAEARATRADVDYLIASVRDRLPAAASAEMLTTTAGVRALVKQERDPYAISRMHRIARDGADAGVISVLGGKITGYRAIAEQATDAVCRTLALRRACRTAITPLPGARPGASASAPAELPEATVAHLRTLYGSRVSRLFALVHGDARLAEPLAPGCPGIAAQVVLAVREEQCLRLADFLLRRSLLGASACLGWQAAPAAAMLMGQELGWRPEQTAGEIDAWRRHTVRTGQLADTDS